jgi:methylmalonyl-CoA mutase N-terminal domain/subunit
VEHLTDTIEMDAMGLIDRIDDLGGAVAAIEVGFQQREIDDAAYAYARGIESGEIVVVGVNAFTIDHDGEPAVLVVDPDVERRQVEELHARKAQRDDESLAVALAEVTAVARSDDNLLYPIKHALTLGATVGEVTGALLPVFGRYRPSF